MEADSLRPLVAEDSNCRSNNMQRTGYEEESLYSALVGQT